MTIYNLDSSIKEISDNFIEESKKSLDLLADMASMEKYMAESYSERSIIELIQNADDAFSTKLLVLEKGNNLYVANNGRPFSEEDVISISRSGASNKSKGIDIGYRGIGFKSSISLSNKIIINSNSSTFTFSKKIAAERLNITNVEEVPTIRIPFLVKDIDEEINNTLSTLNEKGFTTIFVFEKFSKSNLDMELNKLNHDYLLFLNNLKEIDIQTVKTKNKYQVKEEKHFKIVLDINREYKWKSLKNEKVEILLKVNEDNNIVTSQSPDFVFHCYLPTNEMVGYPMKINGDFSTDPSRKHITLDKHTHNILESAVELMFKEIIRSYNTGETFLVDFLQILDKRTTFSKLSNIITKMIEKKLKSKWILTYDNIFIDYSQYIKKPNFLLDEEWSHIRHHSIIYKTLPKLNYNLLNHLDGYMNKFAQNDYSIEDWFTLLQDENFVRNLDRKIINKLYVHLIRKIRTNELLYGEESFENKDVYLPCEDKNMRVVEAQEADFYYFYKNIGENLTDAEKEWLSKKLNLSSQVLSDVKRTKDKTMPNISSTISKNAPSMYRMQKWRSAEAQVIEFEKTLGNKAVDVSKQNLGYDVLSITSEHQEKYIEVKSVSHFDEKFSITNNEYTTAHTQSKTYYLCLVQVSNDIVNFKYIQDPIKNLSFEKVVRQWIWECEEYKNSFHEEYSVKLQGDN